jgi:hypothetical protein
MSGWKPHYLPPPPARAEFLPPTAIAIRQHLALKLFFAPIVYYFPNLFFTLFPFYIIYFKPCQLKRFQQVCTQSHIRDVSYWTEPDIGTSDNAYWRITRTYFSMSVPNYTVHIPEGRLVGRGGIFHYTLCYSVKS